jgi:hypothetical protein
MLTNLARESALSLNAGVRYEYTTRRSVKTEQTLNAISDTPSIPFRGAETSRLSLARSNPPRTIGRLASGLRIHRQREYVIGLALAWLTIPFTTTLAAWQSRRKSVLPRM